MHIQDITSRTSYTRPGRCIGPLPSRPVVRLQWEVGWDEWDEWAWMACGMCCPVFHRVLFHARGGLVVGEGDRPICGAIGIPRTKDPAWGRSAFRSKAAECLSWTVSAYRVQFEEEIRCAPPCVACHISLD
jgi:hypothetical protein